MTHPDPDTPDDDVDDLILDLEIEYAFPDNDKDQP
jgi:hypothetical protein